MLFKEVIGQQQLKQQFAQTILSAKVPHAQMFLGNLGHGGLALALAYAQMLNCETPTENDACGECSSCQKASKLIHPDIHFSYPFPKIDKKETAVEFITDWRKMLSKSPYFSIQDWMLYFEAENKQANIPVRECQDIMRRLNFKSYESKYKVMIIWLPEYLGKEGNSLLKILEEPPENTIFILVAESQDAILSTILSRTQIVKINSIEQELLSIALMESHEVAAENAFNIAALSNGDFIEAQKLLANESSDSALILMEWLQLCLNPNLTSRLDSLQALLKWIDKFHGVGRENQKNIIRYGLYFFEQLFQYQITHKLEGLNSEEKQFAQNFTSRINFNNIELLYNLLNNCHFYIERNASAKITMMSISFKLSKILNGQLVELHDMVDA
jgi:DNA polymerase III subunit delta'